MEKIVYLDNAATTKPFGELAEIYADCSQNYYNPSAVYGGAIDVRKKFESARKNIAKFLGGETGNIIFTSGATEANNLALSSVKFRGGQNLVVSLGEHPAVYQKAKTMQNAGTNVTYLPISADGAVDTTRLAEYITKDTAMVSVMHVSNETGAINDIKTIAKFAKKVNPQVIIHADGTQAFGKIAVDLYDLGVDMYTISAHKIYGPKGVGALWVRSGVRVVPTAIGGGQENGLRSGTENVFGILSLEYCAKRVVQELPQNLEKVAAYRKDILSALDASGVEYKVNGNGSPYILNITFEGLRGEVLLHTLEADGIYISTGSACSSKKPDNRTLRAMGLSDSQIMGTVRISFSAYDNIDTKFVSQKLIDAVLDLRKKISGRK
jgi:cysteine desulfurase